MIMPYTQVHRATCSALQRRQRPSEPRYCFPSAGGDAGPHRAGVPRRCHPVARAGDIVQGNRGYLHVWYTVGIGGRTWPRTRGTRHHTWATRLQTFSAPEGESTLTSVSTFLWICSPVPRGSRPTCNSNNHAVPPTRTHTHHHRGSKPLGKPPE